MPNYAFKCTSCSHEFDLMLKLADHASPQACPECQNGTERVLQAPNFVLAGDGWLGKNLRIRDQMKAKNRRLDAKSRELPQGQKLVPNVDGEEVGSWKEASHLAASKGKNVASYATQVQQEKTA